MCPEDQSSIPACDTFYLLCLPREHGKLEKFLGLSTIKHKSKLRHNIGYILLSYKWKFAQYPMAESALWELHSAVS
jgi:hypothetical protein